MLRLSFFLIAFTETIMISYADVRKHEFNISEFNYIEQNSGDFFLGASITKNDEFNIYINRGYIYFSCIDSNDMRINSHLTTDISDILNNSDFSFIGISKEKREVPIVISAPAELFDQAPEDFGFEAETKASFTAVRSFSPFGVDEDESSYSMSFADENFTQKFFTSDRLSLVVYDQSNLRFNAIYHMRYVVSPETRDRFLKKCRTK